jgi:hypothetical protein
MDKFIYINRNSISPQLSNDIIQLFEEDKDLHTKGTTLGGINDKIKKTSDYIIPLISNQKWVKIQKFLTKELNKNISKYLNELNSMIDPTNNYSVTFKILHTNFLQYDEFMIQKYNKLEGKYVYHNDIYIDFNKNRYRVFTYLWYLNTVTEGGETVFWDSYKIKPEAGKLALFPACWTFPHTGKMPISDNKYIITGWVYVNENKLVNQRVADIINDKNINT